MPFVTKAVIENFMRKQNDMERRIKRLELMALQEAQNKIASLQDKETGQGYKDGYLTIIQDSIRATCMNIHRKRGKYTLGTLFRKGRNFLRMKFNTLNDGGSISEKDVRDN